MDSAQLGLAFSAGTLAFLSPCCLPMLPAYVSHYVGRKEEGRLSLAIAFSATTVGGFLLVFMAIGVVSSLIFRDLIRFASLALPSIGFVMIIVGLASGWSSILDRLPRVSPTMGRGRLTFFLYGVAYGTAAIGCSLPVFLLVVVQSATLGNPGEIIWLFTAYGGGAATLMVPLTISIALAKDMFRNWLSSVMQYVKRVEGTILILAGTYMIYYFLTR